MLEKEFVVVPRRFGGGLRAGRARSFRSREGLAAAPGGDIREQGRNQGAPPVIMTSAVNSVRRYGLFSRPEDFMADTSSDSA